MTASSTSEEKASSASLLSTILTCHNHPHPLFSSPTTDEYVPFHLHLDPKPTAQIGFIPANVLDEIKARNEDAENTVFVHDGRWSQVGLHARLDTFEKRSKALADVVGAWHKEGLFSSALDGWRDEMYGIYSSPSYPYRTWKNKETGPNERAFELERAACALFGLATFGVHMTAYVEGNSASKSGNAVSAEGLRLWTPRRSPTKATWPSYLDNSVAGGITSGDSPYESMVRECWEEAGLQADLVRQHLRQTGVITYVYRTPEGYLQPEVEYTYDLPLPADVRLRPEDGEAEDFRLMEVDEVLQRMGKGEFKPNCALVVIDFLVRHGIVTVQEEPRYMEVVALLHNDLALPGP